MKEWLRKIPHPTYGNYGGAKQFCNSDRCPKPIDKMDLAFKLHDVCLRKSPKHKKICDKRLGYVLRRIDVSELAKPIYGRLYLFSCKLLFR